VPLQCDEPADFTTFRIGLFGLEKLHNPDRTVRNLADALDEVTRVNPQPGPETLPTLNWIGKDAVVRHHQDVPFRLLEGGRSNLHCRQRHGCPCHA
jgi:hypothetical protein